MPAISQWFKAAVLILTMTATLFGQSSLPSKAKATKIRSASSAAQQDLKELRDLVTAQQRQLEAQGQQMEQLKSQLQQLLDATEQANAAAQKGQSSADRAQSTAAQAQQSAAEAQRLADQASANAVEAKTALSLVNSKSQDEAQKISALSDVISRFRFNGDIRVRGESFFQDCAACVDRNRARVRVRFGFEGRLNEDFVGGAALATGSLGDPTTTNETLTNFLDRKTIGLDRAYITYNPVAHKWISATGGKFAYQWQRTQVTGDPDINPEGFNLKLSFDTHLPVVKNVTVQGINYLFSEASTGTDSYALGEQLSAKLQFGAWSATPSFLVLKWNNPDAIFNASAFAVQATSGGKGVPTPGEGPGCAKGNKLPTIAPCAFSPNGMTNATYLDGDGKPHFYSQFLYADLILNNQFKTGSERFPVNLLLEYENNLDAKDHPLDSTGAVVNSLGKQSHTYLVDVSLGQTKNKNDVQFGYAWLREEQDAAIASFAESDQRAPTNILQHRVYALWKVRPNTVASFTWWHGHTLNTGLENNAALMNGIITTAGQAEPNLNRYQFDLIYSF